MSFCRLACLFAGLGGLGLGLSSEGIQPSEPSPPSRRSLSSQSEEVVVDVIVRDKKGRAITDLSQSDFTILDNGLPRPIQSFRLVRGTDVARPEDAKTRVDPLRQIRLVTLIFDRMDMDGRRLSRQAGLELLKESFPQNVYMAVLALDRKLEALQPFTNNRDLLRSAIERATSGANSDFGVVSAGIQRELESLTGPNREGKQGIAERVENMSGSGAAGAEKTMAKILVQMLQFDQRSEMAQSGRSTVFGLLAAVRGQYELPGRKSILYFSSGFLVPQGLEEPYKSVISTANRFNISFYSIDARGLSTTNLNGQATAQLADAVEGSRENGQPQPVGDNNITSVSAMSFDTALDSGKYNTQDTLAILAQSTGGFLIANTNDFRGPLNKVAEEISTYYELSYNPQIEKYDGSFRKIGVKTARADLRVQSRSGYYALPLSMLKGSSGLDAFEIPLLRALSNAPFQQHFPFESAGLHFRSEGHNQTCEFLIDIPLKSLTVQQDKASGTYSGGLSYLALVKDESGQVVKKLQREFPVQMGPDQVLAFHQTRFTDMEYFDVPPGRYIIETAVLDRESGQTSARKSIVLVPPPVPALAMSSVTLIRNWKPKEADATEDDPFVFGDKMMTPILTPTVKKSASTSLPFYMVIYPDPKNAEKPELVMELSRDGKARRVGSPIMGTPDSRGRIQYVATAPIDELAPGNYAVTFLVKQGSERTQEAFALMLEP